MGNNKKKEMSMRLDKDQNNKLEITLTPANIMSVNNDGTNATVLVGRSGNNIVE